MRKSIMKVDYERWLKAQAYESGVWRKQNSLLYRIVNQLLRLFGRKRPMPGDDWNKWWFEKFGGYSFLPRELENVIELGSGPYTNIRLIEEGRDIKYIFCSDPLAMEYIHFRGQWLSTKHHQGKVIVDNHPIETCPFAANYFDLVVLINVLDHVQDAELSLRRALEITKEGGYFVFGQDLTDQADIENIGEDIGHPIRIHHGDIDEIIIGAEPHLFDIIIHTVLPRDEGRNPKAHYGTYLFAGQKK